MTDSSLKIFDIGFNKCGTRTFHHMMIKAGYSCKHWDEGRIALDIKNAFDKKKLPLTQYEGIECFSDMANEIPGSFVLGYKYFQFLVESFPNSLFILTNRNVDDWITSRMNHGSLKKRYLKEFNLESFEDVERFWREDWANHRKNIRDYFESNKIANRLFHLNIENPDLDGLSKFLNQKITYEMWQHKGRSSDRPSRKNLSNGVES